MAPFPHLQRRGDLCPAQLDFDPIALTVIRSTISWTRLFSSTGGIASHRSESLRALRRAASSAYASRSSGASVSLTSVLDDNNDLALELAAGADALDDPDDLGQLSILPQPERLQRACDHGEHPFRAEAREYHLQEYQYSYCSATAALASSRTSLGDHGFEVNRTPPGRTMFETGLPDVTRTST
jgi:hypothetical protein